MEHHYSMIWQLESGMQPFVEAEGTLLDRYKFTISQSSHYPSPQTHSELQAESFSWLQSRKGVRDFTSQARRYPDCVDTSQKNPHVTLEKVHPYISRETLLQIVYTLSTFWSVLSCEALWLSPWGGLKWVHEAVLGRPKEERRARAGLIAHWELGCSRMKLDEVASRSAQWICRPENWRQRRAFTFSSIDSILG